MKIIFHGHSCFEITGSKGRILIDPFLRDNPRADVGPDDYQELDALLITHGHDDHMGDCLEIAKKTGCLFISNFELANFAKKNGVKNIHSMHIGGKYPFGFGTVKLTPALHGSGIPKGDGTFWYGGLACGFLINMDGLWVYHAGDTGLFSDLQLIKNFCALEAAMLPIGDNFGMGPDDAVLAAEMLQAKYVVPMHYNTFPVIRQNPEAFVSALESKVPKTKGVILEPGQSLQI
ncbi:UPF0173 metal-dependent hydrolase [Syntrophobotulus glycolicus DSM 8271]|uniref:UPF0173 metal-dependent hydrolase Sgly_1741 n=1 Tax=Syntrophobotulus glycolicus (strain DSM 8271 / FlGlyR) TaxID=645991 RepID=F0SZ01_SYNGF|nr:metal-dependent hydrolase [Syntrophobotulus glycolicus]ADY56038.1 UPF0173 metal-dependent hydrolase [Syntrophobotulus glycolicus DSM 8271]